MNPAISRLIDQLVEIEASVHDHFEQSVVFGRAAYSNIGGFTPDMLTGWNAADRLV